MLEAGVIEPSKKSMDLSIHTVRMTDASVRICVNYCRLNFISSNNPYQMSRVDDLIDKFGHAKYLSTLDLTKGYNSVPVDERDRDKTTFVSPFRKYKCGCVMM